MAILKTIPSQKMINGILIETSEVSVVSEPQYKTQGESCIVTRNVSKSIIILDHTTTDHVVVKSMVPTVVKPDTNKIDEEFDEVALDKGACVEFRFISGAWLILSSDGLKQS
jgi:hypothetical protein